MLVTDRYVVGYAEGGQLSIKVAKPESSSLQTERVRDLGGERQVSPAIGHHEAGVDDEEEEGEKPEEDLHNTLGEVEKV